MNPQTALLVIDAQRAFCAGQYAAFEAAAVIGRINQVIDKARAKSVPVIFIQHEEAGGPLEHGTDGWQLAVGLNALPPDPRVRKATPDSFHETDLQSILQQRGVSDVIICGFQSEYCVDTTTRRALGLGYSVTLVSDGHSTLDNEVLVAAQISRHHNVTLANLTSFGQKVTPAKASEVRFDPQG